ncbi:MAG: hypothetical protein AAFY65_13595 [Pseudomonadota bacterium]
MTLTLWAVAGMVALRGLVLIALFRLPRDAAHTAFLPPVDTWAALIPFLLVELPVFAALALWLRSGSVWAAWILAALAVMGVVQGSATARRDGVTVLQVDVALALLVLLGLAQVWLARGT